MLWYSKLCCRNINEFLFFSQISDFPEVTVDAKLKAFLVNARNWLTNNEVGWTGTNGLDDSKIKLVCDFTVIFTCQRRCWHKQLIKRVHRFLIPIWGEPRVYHEAYSGMNQSPSWYFICLLL